MKNLIKDERGFTLFETIVVLAVLAIFIGTATEVMFVSSRLLQGYSSSINNRSDAAIAISHIDTSLKRYDIAGAILYKDESIYIKTDAIVGQPPYLVYYYKKNNSKPLQELYSCTLMNYDDVIDTTANTCTVIAKNVINFSVNPEKNLSTNVVMVTLNLSVKVGDSEAKDTRIVTLKANELR